MLLRAVSQDALNRALCNGSDWEAPAEGFNSIPEALADLAEGKFVVVLDDESRENEGDLIMAAETMTTEAMAFMVEYTSGVICVPLEGRWGFDHAIIARCIVYLPMACMPSLCVTDAIDDSFTCMGRDLDRLQIPLMVSSAENEEMLYTAFTVTVDARHGTTTGISAADRTATVKALADRTSQPGDFKKPGHIFPLRYRHGGVLKRPGHTEAAVDLARLANCAPVGVLCEIVSKADGSMARTPELLDFAKQHNLKCITIADLVAFRMKNETLIQLVSSQRIHTRHGSCMTHCYRDLIDGTEHIALISGNVAGKSQVLTIGHTGCALDDLFGVQGSQLDAALHAVCNQAEGVLIYLQSQGKAAALSEQLSQLESPSDQGGSNNDPLHHGIVACILRDLGVKSMRVLNETDGLANSMNGSGLSASESVSLASLGHGSNGNGGQSSDSSSDLSYQGSVEAQLDQWMPRT